MASVPFNNLITFSRGSNATLTGSNGLIQWAPNNSTTFSEQFDNAAWFRSSLTISANAAVAPDGTTTADLVYPTSTGAARRFTRSGAGGSGIYTNSLYLKYSGIRWVYMFDNAGSGIAAWFDVQNGAVGNVMAGYTATITAAGNGWYRCAVSNTTAGIPNYVNYIGLSDANNSENVTANATDGVLFWGAQLELGSAATTYNSTTVKNLLGFSEAFDNAAWTKSNASIVTGAQANPVNGAFNAQKLMENTATGLHYVAVTNNLTGSFNYSVYAKAGERTILALARSSDSSPLRFDLINGVVIQTGVGWSNGTIVPVGNGWYRCSGNISLTASWVYISPNIANPYTGDGNSGVYIYGAQLSDSASLDPYVPTPAAAPSSTAYYGPRFDYDPVTLAPKGLLVEEARTNLLVYSEQFDNAAWTKGDTTVTANATVAPDGTNTADKLVETATNTFHYALQNLPSAVTTIAYTASVYVKAAERTWCVLALGGTAFNSVAWFNLSTGTIGTQTGTPSSVTITTAGNGWWRITITKTPALVGTANVAINVSTGDGVASYAGTAGSGIFIYGAQLEAGAFATSYIPTVASTVTRSADVATINGSLFSQWYGQTQGTFVVGVSPSQISPQTGIMSANDGTANNRIDIRSVSSSLISVAGVQQASIFTSALVVNFANQISVAYQLNDFALTANGSSPSTDTSGTVPTVSRLLIGGLDAGAPQLNGHIRSINYVPTRIADFQLQALTELPLVPTLDLDFLNNLYEA